MQTETSEGKDAVSGCDVKLWEPIVSQVSNAPSVAVGIKAELKDYLDQPHHLVEIAQQMIPDANMQLSHAQGGLLQLLEGSLSDDVGAHDVFHGFQASAGGLIFDQGPSGGGAFGSLAEPVALPSGGLEIESHGAALETALLEQQQGVAGPEVVLDPKLDASTAAPPAAAASIR